MFNRAFLESIGNSSIKLAVNSYFFKENGKISRILNLRSCYQFNFEISVLRVPKMYVSTNQFHGLRQVQYFLYEYFVAVLEKKPDANILVKKNGVGH